MKRLVTTLVTSLICLEFSHAQTSTPEKPAVAPSLAAVMEAEGYSAVKLAVKGNQFFIDVTIDGKAGSFLLDTGAMASLLKEEALKEYAMDVSDATVEVAGGGGITKSKATAKTNTLTCGPAKEIAQSFHVMPVSHWPENQAKHFDGLLGTDFLKARKGLLDFTHGVLWLRSVPAQPDAGSQFETKMNSQGHTAVKFVEEQNHLFADATIGDGKARFVLDSGASVSLFKESAAGKYDFEIIKGRGVINGVNGSIEITAMAKTKQLKLGDVKPIAQDFYVMNMTNWPQNYADRFDGILGNDFFKTKKSIIDYANNVLWIMID